MLDLIFLMAYVAALLGAGAYAFARPAGVYWRSAAGLAGAALLATALWFLASPMISNAAGFGAFVLWLGFIGLAALLALTACTAATLRHILNALGARAL